MTSTALPSLGAPVVDVTPETVAIEAPRSGGSLRAHLTAGIAALAVLGTCAWLGVVKFDEGWYIVSSRLAAHGALPYRDFAFTQSPLLAYVLAPSQLIAPGIMSARITSCLCAALGIVLMLATARRLGGDRAAWFTGAVLLSAFPALPYWYSETKTYGLASLFLAATVATLTSRIRASVRLPLATAMAAGFALTRLSGAALAVIVFAYCLYYSPDLRTWKRVMLVAVGIAGPFLLLLWLGSRRSLWNLFSYHQMTAYWANPRVSTFSERVREVLAAWPFLSFVLLLVIGLIAIVRGRAILNAVRARFELVVVLVGMVAFVATHMLGGAFYAEEYVSPLIPTLVMLAVVAVIRLCAAIPFAEYGVILVVIALGLLLTSHPGYLGAPGWNGAPQALAPLTRCIEANSQPGDRVFALVLLEAVPASRREAVDGTSLGVFSYQDVSTERAEYLHILNAERVERAIADPATSVVVLTDVDRQLLSFRGWFSQDHQDIEPIDRALRAAYRPVCSTSVVRELQGQEVNATVYARVT